LHKFLKILTLILITVFIFSCSNDNKPTQDHDNSIPQSETIKIQNENIESGELYDFRSARWGMTMEDVIESEPEKPISKSDNTLDFMTTILDMQTQVRYTFKDDQLIRGGFFFKVNDNEKKDYIDSYNKLKEMLIQINRKPFIDTIRQIDTFKKIDDSNMGEAVCNGDVIYASQWDIPRADIQLLLRGENSECIITALYLSDQAIQEMLKDRIEQQKQES